MGPIVRNAYGFVHWMHQWVNTPRDYLQPSKRPVAAGRERFGFGFRTSFGSPPSDFGLGRRKSRMRRRKTHSRRRMKADSISPL